jgi:hypothetical protein
VLPLANFGSVNFTGAFVNNFAGTIGTFTHDNIVMTTSNGTVKAQPGALTGYGTAFADTWRHT